MGRGVEASEGSADPRSAGSRVGYTRPSGAVKPLPPALEAPGSSLRSESKSRNPSQIEQGQFGTTW